MNQKINELE
jgi:adenylate kinase family enzyme